MDNCYDSPPPAYHIIFSEQLENNHEAEPPPEYSSLGLLERINSSPQYYQSSSCLPDDPYYLFLRDLPETIIVPQTTEFSLTAVKFSYHNIRKAFRRQVYTILFLQLAVISIITAIFLFLPILNHWIRKNSQGTDSALNFLGLLVPTCVIEMSMAGCQSLRRKSPTNILCLCTLTLMRGILSGYMSAIFGSLSLLLFFSFTALVHLILAFFSVSSPTLGLLLIVCVFGVIMLSFEVSIGLTTEGCFIPVMGFMASLVFFAHMVSEIKLITAGRYMYNISPEEYIFAAFTFFTYFPFNCFFSHARISSDVAVI